MMDTNDVSPMIDDLESHIDELEEALAPLLKAPLRDTTSKLPLLDKAKVNVLTSYAIESIVFGKYSHNIKGVKSDQITAYLNLNSIDAKAHPVFEELARVKQYFAKIKLAEEGPPQRPDNRSLNTSAANRFIKHGLAGNEQYDKERAERQAKEKAGAKIKFDELSEKMEMERIAKKRKAVEDAEKAGRAEEDSSSDSSDEDDSAEEKADAQEKHTDEKRTAGPVSSKRQRQSKRVSKSSKPPPSHKEVFQNLLSKSTMSEEQDDGATPKKISDRSKPNKSKKAKKTKT